MATFLGYPKVQYFDSNGDPLSGGKVYTSNGGSSFDSAPRATYPTITDALAATNANTNPVILDSRGEATIVIQGDTRIVLKDSADTQIWSVDHFDQASSDIYDSNGNLLLKFSAINSAVNEIQIQNAATTLYPIISSQGSDTNIGVKLTAKGSGTAYIEGGTTGTIELNDASTGAINARTAMTAHSTLTVTGAVTCNGGLTATATTAFNLIPAGTIIAYGGSSAPTGYLACDGSAVSRTTYATLYANIGTTWGVGDGSTTFNVPNFNRRTLVGSGGSGTATLANTVGSTGGAETHTLTVAEMPAHTHSQVQSAVATQSGSNQTVLEAGSTTNTGSSGGDGAHNNMQPSAVVKYCIRAY